MSSTRISPLPDTPRMLAQPDALRAELGTSVSDGDLTGLLVQATGLIEAYLFRPLLMADYLDVFRFPGDVRPMLVQARPVMAVAGIKINGVDLDLDGLDIDLAAGIIYPPACGFSGCCYGPNRVSITYTAGFVVAGMKDGDGTPLPPTLPSHIERACLDTAKAIYHAGDRDPLVRSESEQGIGSTSYLDPDPSNGGLPASAAAMLAPWRGSGIR